MMRVFDSSLKAGASSEGPPCSEVRRFWRSVSVITPKSTSTFSTPSISMSRSRMSVVILCFNGQPAVVRATPTVTPEPSIWTSRTMFKETRSRPISGSRTSLKASRMPASEKPSAGSSGSGVWSTRFSAVSDSTSRGAVPWGVPPRNSPALAGLSGVRSNLSCKLPLLRLRNQPLIFSKNLLRSQTPADRKY